MLKRKEFKLEVSTSPIENIKAFRRITSSNEWDTTRHEGSRLVDRFAIIMPMAQSARTLGLEVMNGPLQALKCILGPKRKVVLEQSIWLLGLYLEAKVTKKREN